MSYSSFKAQLSTAIRPPCRHLRDALLRLYQLCSKTIYCILDSILDAQLSFNFDLPASRIPPSPRYDYSLVVDAFKNTWVVVEWNTHVLWALVAGWQHLLRFWVVLSWPACLHTWFYQTPSRLSKLICGGPWQHLLRLWAERRSGILGSEFVCVSYAIQLARTPLPLSRGLGPPIY